MDWIQFFIFCIALASFVVGMREGYEERKEAKEDRKKGKATSR